MGNASSTVRVVILAGGQGARFWPISRMSRPKQFLSISTCGESLIQATSRRVAPICPPKEQIVVTNVLHERLIREHVPEASVLCEPEGKNTAPSIGLAAMAVASQDPDAVMVVLPADHAVKDEQNLLTTLNAAIDAARRERSLVTIGVPPASPNTAYGYIKRGEKIGTGAYRVARFFEKPSLERALKYVESGDFYWNSGMFVWRASVILEAIEAFLPALHQGLMRIKPALGTPDERTVIDELFPQLESISIDFGILEHARNTVVIEAQPFGWNDVGSWDAWAEHFELDEAKNLLHGDVIAIDSQRCVIHSEHKLTAVLGVKDLVVIDSGDALLICPREQVQEVRKVVERLKKSGRTNLV